MNQTNLPLKRKFIQQLREEYNSGTSIWDCFRMYMGFMKAIGCEYLTDMTDWQELDYYYALTEWKTLWHRNRRAGKTLGVSNLAVFFALIQFGYRANKGKVVWRAPFSDQLSQAQDWLEQNPFVEYISDKNEVGVLDSFPINMGSLGSGGKAASKGASVYIMDEFRDVYKGHKMYDLAGRASDMLAESPNPRRDQRFITASTGCRLTMFHNQYLSGEYKYCWHNYKECQWISDEYVESKAKEHPEDPYFKDQEFMSIWVARGDTAFRNVYIVDMEAKTVVHNENIYKFGDHPFFPSQWLFPTARKAGVDFNESAGHYVVAGSFDEEAIYVNFERVVSTIPELKAYGHQYQMEIESGPFEMNIECARECHQQHIKCIHKNWEKDVIAQRFKHLMSKMIIIDRKLAPITLQNLQEAVFDENQRQSKLKKRADQHGLDALMHMIHRYSTTSRIMTPDERKYMKRHKSTRVVSR